MGPGEGPYISNDMGLPVPMSLGKLGGGGGGGGAFHYYVVQSYLKSISVSSIANLIVVAS